MKKVIIAIGIFSTIAFATMAQTATSPVAKGNAGSATVMSKDDSANFKFEVDEVNFGTITQGDTVHRVFNFTNTGGQPLIITEAHGSCGCTQPKFAKDPIKKGEKSTIDVTFNSTGKMGIQDKTITISSNAKGGQKVLHLKGTVEAPKTPATTPAAPAPATPAPVKK
ncbi:MAG: DUF1573 domain-containing protein [Bacteroidota bacterium]